MGLRGSNLRMSHILIYDVFRYVAENLVFLSKADRKNGNSTELNKMLVTLKNHTLLPANATNIAGPRSSKAQKNIKTFIKTVETFVESDLSIWKDYKSFIADANRIALKSKLDQITAFQSNPQIAGFFLDQWADCGTDFYGLCDENRVSKGFDSFIKEITTPSRALVSELEHVVAPQSEVSFQVTLLNNSRYEDVSVEIRLIDEKGKEVKEDFVVPNVNMFLNDVEQTVREHNRENPENMIQDKYKTGSTGSFLLNILPTALLVILMFVFLLIMFRRMNMTMAGENNRTLSFGKARVKEIKDEKRRTTFEQVAEQRNLLLKRQTRHVLLQFGNVNAVVAKRLLEQVILQPQPIDLLPKPRQLIHLSTLNHHC